MSRIYFHRDTGEKHKNRDRGNPCDNRLETTD